MPSERHPKATVLLTYLIFKRVIYIYSMYHLYEIYIHILIHLYLHKYTLLRQKLRHIKNVKSVSEQKLIQMGQCQTRSG